VDRNKAIDLIKAKTLGCLTKDEDAEFKEYIESGEDFPWDVLGEYQNLTAMLPILLQLEVPDSELKDNVARKLYKIIEELKAKQKAELTPVPETETAEDGDDLETVLDVEEELPEEPIKFSVDDSSSLSEPDLSQVSSASTLDLPPAEQDVEKKSGREKVEDIIDEKLERQKTIEYIDKYHKEEVAALEGASKRNKLISIILFVISLIFLVVVYFLLSADISSNKEEIEKLKIGFDGSHTILQDENLV
jgi:flagellar basal body-associated protein FliL